MLRSRKVKLARLAKQLLGISPRKEFEERSRELRVFIVKSGGRSSGGGRTWRCEEAGESERCYGLQRFAFRRRKPKKYISNEEFFEGFSMTKDLNWRSASL